MTGDGGGALGRVQAKLAASLERGDFYEAHQLYRTLHFRLLAKKNYEELLELLHKGASEFLKHNQQQSAVDVAILYVDVLTKAKKPVDKDIVKRISDLFNGISPSVPERETYINNAIRWSMGTTNAGDPLLHKNIAMTLWKEKNYRGAQQHFYYSNDGLSLAGMLVEMHTTQGSLMDLDVYVVTAILQLLCKRKKQLAQDTFLYYVGLHPGILNKTGPPYLTELLNFTWFLLQAIDTKNPDTFRQLVEKYDENIKHEAAYPDYLEKIGRIWFNIMPAKNNFQNGLFGNLIQSIFSGMENDCSGTEEEPAPKLTPVAQMQAEDVE